MFTNINTSVNVKQTVLHHGFEFVLNIIDMLVVVLLLYCYYEYVQNFGQRNLKEKELFRIKTLTLTSVKYNYVIRNEVYQEIALETWLPRH